MSKNLAILLGNLCDKPQAKSAGSTSVANFTVATSESWNDKASGEKKERTEFTKVVAWGKTAELCATYLDKGSRVYLEGKLQTRNYDDKDGNKKYVTEVVASSVQFLDGKKKEEAAKPDAIKPDANMTTGDIPW